MWRRPSPIRFRLTPGLVHRYAPRRYSIPERRFVKPEPGRRGGPGIHGVARLGAGSRAQVPRVPVAYAGMLEAMPPGLMPADVRRRARALGGYMPPRESYRGPFNPILGATYDMAKTLLYQRYVLGIKVRPSWIARGWHAMYALAKVRGDTDMLGWLERAVGDLFPEGELDRRLRFNPNYRIWCTAYGVPCR